MPPPAPVLLSSASRTRVHTYINSANSDYDLVMRQQPKHAKLSVGNDKREHSKLGSLLDA